jgi:transposase
MKRFVQGQERSQGTLFPACLDEYVSDENPVRVIDVFVEELDLRALGFDGVVPHATGRPAYHPAALLKIYIYGYLNRIPSSRRLEQETGRNLELMWLTGQLQPDHKTIARFRKDNGPAIRAVCRQFVGLCRKLNLFSQAVVAIDGSKFKAVNTRDKNFTPTLRQPNSPSASSRSRPASHTICPPSTPPTGKRANWRRRRRGGSGTRSRCSGSRCSSSGSWSSRCWPLPTSRSRSPIRMRAP